jgi:hypothetical protein
MSGEKQPLKVRFGEVTKDNIRQLQRLNLSIFPVRYSDKWYKDVQAAEHAPYVVAIALVAFICVICILRTQSHNQIAIPHTTVT